MQLGILATEHGQYGVARKRYGEVLDVARAMADRMLEGNALNNLGHIEELLGNYDAAFELFQSARRLSVETGLRMLEAYLLCNLAGTAYQRGAAEDAIVLADQASIAAKSLKDATSRRPSSSYAATRFRRSATGTRRCGATSIPPRYSASSAARPCLPSR